MNRSIHLKHVLVMFVFMIILIFSIRFIYLKYEGKKGSNTCNLVNVGDSEERVIKLMGTPKKIVFFTDSIVDHKKYEVFQYEIPFLASSNVDIYFDIKSHMVAYTTCGN